MYMYVHVVECSVSSVVGSSPTRGSSFFSGKVTTLGVLCCFALFVCLTLLASFFLPSFSSLIKTYIYMYMHVLFAQAYGVLRYPFMLVRVVTHFTLNIIV